MYFHFTNELPLSRVDETVGFLMGPRLWIPSTDYPDFMPWLDKTHRELKKGAKRAMVALNRNDVVGVCVYQRHRHDADALEIKNITVRPDARGRYVASFLVRNAEIEGTRDYRTRHAVCDAKAHNTDVRSFLLRHGYRSRGKADLYALGAGADIVYRKSLRPSPSP